MKAGTDIGPPALSLQDPVAGLFPYLAVAEMERSDPAVFIAAADTADTLAYGFRHAVTSKGSGAGLTREAAIGAAIGEGIERYAFSLVDPEERHFGSYKDLTAAGENPIPPGRWALYDPSQYDVLPLQPFTEETPIAWIPAQSLTRRVDCLVPACMASIPYTPFFEEQGERLVTWAISTGAACATTRAEALLKGLCELIERDAFMILWRNRLRTPRVRIDPASPLYAIFHERFDRPGLHYALYRTTLDLGMPSFVGVATNTRGPFARTIVGGAAHPDANRAALKTLLEMAQGLKWMDFMRHTVAVEPEFRNIRSFDDRAHLYASNDLREAFAFLEDAEEVDLSEVVAQSSWEPAPIPRLLRRCVETLAEHGYEAIGIEMTPDDALACGLHVTRAFVPGLETMEGDHLAPYLGGARWREVPVRLGLRSAETPLDGVNPYPHPYP